jgi:hypothetical protein
MRFAAILDRFHDTSSTFAIVCHKNICQLQPEMIIFMLRNSYIGITARNIKGD